MPRVLVTALAAPAGVLVAIGGNLTAPTAPALPAPAKATSKVPARPGPVALWHEANRPPKGTKLDCWLLYGAYKKWCNGNYVPVSYTNFMFEMQQLKIKKAEENGKAHFTF